MNNATTIIGVVLVVLFVLPVFIIQLSARKRRKKFENDFKQHGIANGITVVAPDFWNSSYAIAMDSNSKNLIYAVKEEGTTYYKIVKLNSNTNCRVASSTRKEGSIATTDSIKLILESKSAKEDVVELEFFSTNKNAYPTNELKLAEKWAEQIKKVVA